MSKDLVRSSGQALTTPGVTNPFKKKSLSFCKISENKLPDKNIQAGAIMFSDKLGINPNNDGVLAIPVRIFGGKPISTKFLTLDKQLRQKEFLDFAGFRLRNEEPPKPIIEIDEKMPICSSPDLINSSCTLSYQGKIIKKCEFCPHASRFINAKGELILRKFKTLQPELTEDQARFIGQKRQDDFLKWYMGDGTERYPGIKEMKLSPTCDTNFTFVVGTEKAEQLTLVVYKRTTEKTGIELLRALEDVPVPWAYKAILTVKDWTHPEYRGFQYPHLILQGFDEQWQEHHNKERFDSIVANIDDYFPSLFDMGDTEDVNDAAKFGLPPELADMEGFEFPAKEPVSESVPKPQQQEAESNPPVETAPEPVKEEVVKATPPPEPTPEPEQQETAPPPDAKVEDYEDLDMSELEGLSDF